MTTAISVLGGEFRILELVGYGILPKFPTCRRIRQNKKGAKTTGWYRNQQLLH